MESENKKGTTYNLATSQVVDGKRVWTSWGTLFIRTGGAGVLYLKQGEAVIQIGVFQKRPKSEAKPEPASAQS